MYSTMLTRWRSTSLLIMVILLTMASAVALVHWHEDWTGQDCGLCNVRHLPTLHPAAEDHLLTLAVREWEPSIVVVDATFDGFARTRLGRAPPVLLG
jgi:hypothetical protein